MNPDVTEHGLCACTKRAPIAARAGPLISYERFVADHLMTHTLVTDGFRIVQFSEVVIHRITGASPLTHARLTLAEYAKPVATWHKPVVIRLFWLGFPVHDPQPVQQGRHPALRTTSPPPCTRLKWAAP